MSDPLTRVPNIWRDGMLTTEGYRVVHRIDFSMITPDAIGHWLFAAGGKSWHDTLDGHEVALDDPSGATTGCLAAVCRGLYGDPLLHAVPFGEGLGWRIRGWDDGCVAEGPTEAAAWWNAILAHPSLQDVR